MSRRVTDLCLVSEPNKDLAKKSGWYMDENADAAIWLVNRSRAIETHGKGAGFVWVETEDGVVVLSCYFSPNKPVDAFNAFLDEIGQVVRSQQGKKVIVTEYFNAAAVEWGSRRTDPRGWSVLEWMAQHVLLIHNQDDSYTFERGSQRSSIDLTLSSERSLRAFLRGPFLVPHCGTLLIMESWS